MLTDEKSFVFAVVLLLTIGGWQVACGQRLEAHQQPEKMAVLHGEAYLNYPGANAGFSTHNYPIKVVATNPGMTKRYGFAVVGQTASRHKYSMRVKVPDSGQIVLHAYYDHRKFPPAIAQPAKVSVSDGQEKEVPNFTVNFVDHPRASSIEGGAGTLVGVMSIVRYYYKAASYDDRVGTTKETIQRLEQLEGWPSSAEHGSESTVPRRELVAYYPFDGDAEDASGNGNTGTVHGATLTMGRDGNPKSAYFFDGADDRIAIGSTQSLGLDGSFSMSLWIKAESKGQIISNERGGEAGGGDLSLTASGYHFYKGDNDLTRVPFKEKIVDGRWHHIVVIHNGTGARVYVDGKLENDQVQRSLMGDIVERNTDFYPFYPSDLRLNIGRSAKVRSYHPIEGKIDEVRIYDRVLTREEVKSVYENEY